MPNKRKQKFKPKPSRALDESPLSPPTYQSTTTSKSMFEKGLSYVNELSDWKIAVTLAILGLLVFARGLTSPFMGDDQLQIVDNPLVHTISEIPILFHGSTFYTGEGIAPLTGTYYRPLMMVTFALIYSIFGAQPIAFHTIQIVFCIGSAFLLYKILKYFTAPVFSLLTAMLFLVHPLNSQVAFAIPALQDTLFMFFGLLSLWLVIRLNNLKGAVAAAVCLFLAFLSKEVGILFIVIDFLYLFFFARNRVKVFLQTGTPTLVIYLTLYLIAIKHGGNPHLAPIGNVSLWDRIITIPSILLFFIERIFVPLKLATGYYWFKTSITISVILSICAVGLVSVILRYIQKAVRKRASDNDYRAYLFFGIWSIIGLMPYLQIIPLDMTVCETWLYFSLAGFLGLTGILLVIYEAKLSSGWFIVISVSLILALGTRTSFRGADYTSEFNLASRDVSVSTEDYPAYSVLSYDLNQQGDYKQAKADALKSISIYPYFTNYANLGVSLTNLGDYPGAVNAYNNSLKYGQPAQIYENLAALSLVTGNYVDNQLKLQTALERYPQDSLLWTLLACLEEQNSNPTEAKSDITKAASYGQVSPNIYNNVMNDQPFSVSLSNSYSVRIP